VALDVLTRDGAETHRRVQRVLICDDSATSRRVLGDLIRLDPELELVGEASDGAECIELARRLAPDVVLMDITMPVMDGVEATRRLRELLPSTRVVALTSHGGEGTVVRMVEAGASSYALKGGSADDLRRALSATSGGYLDDRLVPPLFEEVVRLFQRERDGAAQLAALTRGIVAALAAAVEARDGYTGGHIDRVSRLALRLSDRVAPGLTDDPRIEFGYLLHDVGKLGVSDAVLLKPGRLDDRELREMRAHVEIGVRLLEPIPDFEPVREIVLCHHEHWDGGGYPRGLAGEEIPVPARLFALCDAYDAMTSDRPYRLRLDEAAVERELRAGAGTQFDPDAVEAFLELVAATR
jgi:putative two-component system response regulator